MAIPRVFVSSTYYDLKHIRSSLELFIESIGFEAVLSEKGSVTYVPDQELEKSCYREVKSSDIYVLIIGGRYGSEVSETKGGVPKTFYEQYESITKTEYKAALEDDVPVYILIERSVYSEYHTFLKNRENKQVVYAHVDSVNVFSFIENILTQKRNNPIQTFDRHADIESWLRIQWAGLFRELLKQRSSHAQLKGLTDQVKELSEVNKTLRRYLEEVVSKVAPQKAGSLIEEEDARLSEAQVLRKLSDNKLVRHIMEGTDIALEQVKLALEQSRSIGDFVENLRKVSDLAAKRVDIVNAIPEAFESLNIARNTVRKPQFKKNDLVEKQID